MNKINNILVNSSISINQSLAIIYACEGYLEVLSQPEDSPLSIQLKNHKEALNASCFIISFNTDLVISIRELLLAINRPAEIIYYIKHIYIHLYRFFEKIEYEFRIIKDISVKYGIGGDEYRSTSKKITDFKAKYYERIKENRNKFYAHIKNIKDFRDYHFNVERLEVINEIDMCDDILDIHVQLFEILSKTISSVVFKFNNLKMESEELWEAYKANAYSKMEILKEVDRESYDKLKVLLDRTFENPESLL